MFILLLLKQYRVDKKNKVIFRIPADIRLVEEIYRTIEKNINCNFKYLNIQDIINKSSRHHISMMRVHHRVYHLLGARVFEYTYCMHTIRIMICIKIRITCVVSSIVKVSYYQLYCFCRNLIFNNIYIRRNSILDFTLLYFAQCFT